MMGIFKRGSRFANPVSLDERLRAYVGRTGAIQDASGPRGYLHISLDVIADTTGALWWKTRHVPREVLRWDLILDPGKNTAEYLQGEYDNVEALNELPESSIQLRGQKYSITWLQDDEAIAARREHFAENNDE